MTKVIQIVPYDSRWPALFEKEAFLIKQALGENCLEIHHIGSTSVPSLAAKPIIDIVVVIRETLSVVDNLEKLGYSYKGELNIPFRLYFNKKIGTTVHLHVYEVGNPEIELNLIFRDHLRLSLPARQEYEQMKLNLMAYQALYPYNNLEFSGYTLAKDPFIKKILEQAGFQGLCMRFCTHHEEWDAARLFRQQYYSGPLSLNDLYTWTFDRKDHIHFIFYQGAKIIGYAHLQLWPEARATIRIMIITLNHRQQEITQYFLSRCELWLRRQGIQSLHVNSSPKSYPFYCDHGYIPMPFNDPDNFETTPRNIGMGKLLTADE